MDTTLEVNPRDAGGKGVQRKARAKGQVPAVVYGPAHPARAVTLDPVKLLDIFKKSRDANTVLKVKLGSETIPCLVREVQRHPASRKVVHVDLYAVPNDREVEVIVPINPIGKPKGLTVGGRIRVIRRELKVRCKWDKIPAKLDVDLSDVDIEQYVKASQFKLPEGVSLAFDNDFNVVGVTGKKIKEEALPEAPKPAAEGEAAAAPAAEKKE